MKRIILLFLAFTILFISCSDSDPQNAAVPSIQVFETKTESVTIIEEFVGQVYGQKDIAIRARVEGFLEGIYFDEGSLVKKGKLLYKIESQPYEADVAAKMSKVAEAKTMLAKALSDLNRIRPLAENNAVSQSDLDAAVANHDAAEETVKAAEANLRASNIYLSYTNVKSPLTGIIGKTKAKVGDFVGKSPNPVILNTVSLIDTMLVEFFITESKYLLLFRTISEKYPEFKKTGVLRSGRIEPNLELILADGSIYQHKGLLKFIDRDIDPTTGSILAQASFPNPDKLLRPGLFAKIRGELSKVDDGILIPQRCVMELQGNFSVYIVNNENLIESRDIKASKKIGSKWLISEGLKPGEKVVFEGLQKVKPGVTVNAVSAEPNSKTNEIKE